MEAAYIELNCFFPLGLAELFDEPPRGETAIYKLHYLPVKTVDCKVTGPREVAFLEVVISTTEFPGFMRPYFSYRCDGRTYDVIDEDDLALYIRHKKNPLHQITILN